MVRNVKDTKKTVIICDDVFSLFPTFTLLREAYKLNMKTQKLLGYSFCYSLRFYS